MRHSLLKPRASRANQGWGARPREEGRQTRVAAGSGLGGGGKSVDSAAQGSPGLQRRSGVMCKASLLWVRSFSQRAFVMELLQGASTRWALRVGCGTSPQSALTEPPASPGVRRSENTDMASTLSSGEKRRAETLSGVQRA